MKKVLVLGKEKLEIGTWEAVFFEKDTNLKYGQESWRRIKSLIWENGIDTIAGSKDNIHIINRLLWECDTLRQYILTDSDEAFQIEKANDRRNMLRWDMVANKAKEDDVIEQSGWINSFTGQSFSEKEICEYAENALYKLKDICNDTINVLEIGIASGLTCMKIVPLVRKYTGLDISKRTLEKTRQMMERKNVKNVELFLGGGLDVEVIGVHDVHLVIMNSVAQYFPGYNYFIEVLRRCIRCMSRKGVIFVGDIMDLDKRENYLRELKAAGGKASGEDLWYPQEFMKEVPAFLPEVCKTVISKKEKYTIENELTRFRYDVIYEVDKEEKNNHGKTKFQFNKDLLQK